MVHLLAIDRDGQAQTTPALDDVARGVCQATGAMYARTGFEPPWVGYLAALDGQLVGTCAFKTPPHDGQVEIAYFTFPAYEGRGIATRMAAELVRLAHATDPQLTVTAQTLPNENASTSILKKLGFRRTDTVEHPEDGLVWQWELAAQSRPDPASP